MSVRIIHFPNKVKSSAVFLTIKPVTHRPDEAVNSASMTEIPLVVENGRSSSSVLTPIMPR